MKRLFSPILFLMANAPDVEKNLELLMIMLQATTESVKNIKNGLDNFHASILKMAQAMPDLSSTKTTETVAKPEPSPEPSVTP